MKPAGEGPATYVDQDGGQHSIRWQGRHLSVRTQDIRTALTYTTFLTHDEHRWPHGSSPFNLLVSFVDGLRNECVRLGWLFHDGWRRAKANAFLSGIVYAILHVAANGLHLNNCVGARLGHGMSILPPLEDIGHTVIVWWRQGRPRTVWYNDTPGSSRVKLQDLIAEWQHACFIQFLTAGDDDLKEICIAGPEIPPFTPPQQVPRFHSPGSPASTVSHSSRTYPLRSL